MKNRKIILLILLVSLLNFSYFLPNSFASSSDSEEWEEMWGGENNDVLTTIAIDSSDSIYLGGMTQVLSGNLGVVNSTMTLIKYNNSGVLLWNRTWGEERIAYCYDMEIDLVGNIYLTGFSKKNLSAPRTDMELAKFNSSGDLQWNIILEYKSVQYGYIRGKGLSLDSEGNIYIAGDIRDHMASDYFGFFLIKYDKFGKQIWNHTWGGDDTDIYNGIVIDSKDNIYVVGYTKSLAKYGPDSDLILVKYDTTGTLQWYKTWGDNGYDYGNAIALDSEENILIAGDIYRATPNPNLCLVKYDSSGNQLWDLTWDSGSPDYGYAIALDSQDNIYFGGSTRISGGSNVDITLVRFDNSGTLQWSKTWGTEKQDWVQAIALDSSDKVFLAGLKRESDLSENDMFLMKIEDSSFEAIFGFDPFFMMGLIAIVSVILIIKHYVLHKRN